MGMLHFADEQKPERPNPLARFYLKDRHISKLIYYRLFLGTSLIKQKLHWRAPAALVANPKKASLSKALRGLLHSGNFGLLQVSN